MKLRVWDAKKNFRRRCGGEAAAPKRFVLYINSDSVCRCSLAIFIRGIAKSFTLGISTFKTPDVQVLVVLASSSSST